MSIDSNVEWCRGFYLRTNGPVCRDPMNSHAAWIVVSNQHMRAGDICGDMNRARRQGCWLTVGKQGTRVWIDAERAQTVLAATRCRTAGREIAGPAVAPGDI